MSTFGELFVLALGDPTAPRGVERWCLKSSAQGNGRAVEVGLKLVLGLGLDLWLNRGLVAKSLTALSLMGVSPPEEKSKYRSNAKSFWSWRAISCNVFRSSWSAVKCWLSCWVVLWRACRDFACCWRDEDKVDEDPGCGCWTSATGFDGFFGRIRGRLKVPSVMSWLIGRAWDGISCGGISQVKWAKGRFIVVELHCGRIGSEEDWEWGRKAGARGFNDINGGVRWSSVVVLPIVERGEMCLESYNVDVCYPKGIVPICRALVWDSIVKVKWNGVVWFCVCD